VNKEQLLNSQDQLKNVKAELEAGQAEVGVLLKGES
jgi:hypothetical protein